MSTFSFDKKDVFSWSNCEEAQKYVGQEGYFGDTLEGLEAQIQRQNLLKLGRIDASDAICFHTLEQDELDFDTGSDECLFLPADKVKQPKPKRLRQFKDYAEFIRTVGSDLGDRLAIRRKELPIIHRVLIIEFHQGINTVGLGLCTYSYRELFEDYEWQDKEGNWQTFGVEE